MATVVQSLGSKEGMQELLWDNIKHGYRLGRIDEDNVYINNHLRFVLSYHMHTK